MARNSHCKKMQLHSWIVCCLQCTLSTAVLSSGTDHADKKDGRVILFLSEVMKMAGIGFVHAF
jgi:hypothetical protein